MDKRAQNEQDALRDIGNLISRRTGIDISRRDTEMVLRRINQRLDALGMKDPLVYYFLLLSEEAEWEIFLEEILVGETRFMRDPIQFDFLRQVEFPAIITDLQDSFVRRCPCLSIGCSTGQEVYSIAMVMSELEFPPNTELHVTGLDLSNKALSKAESGAYSDFEIRGLSTQQVEQWLNPEDEGYRIRSSLLKLVDFRQGNVSDPLFTSTLGTRYRVIFMKNILFYLHEEMIQQVLASVKELLVEGGLLLLAPSEFMHIKDEDFQEFYYQNTLFYRKKTSSKELC
jgi:chemotaxis methyl-accepting protein methylase